MTLVAKTGQARRQKHARRAELSPDRERWCRRPAPFWRKPGRETRRGLPAAAARLMQALGFPDVSGTLQQQHLAEDASGGGDGPPELNHNSNVDNQQRGQPPRKKPTSSSAPSQPVPLKPPPPQLPNPPPMHAIRDRHFPLWQFPTPIPMGGRGQRGGGAVAQPRQPSKDKINPAKDSPKSNYVQLRVFSQLESSIKGKKAPPSGVARRAWHVLDFVSPILLLSAAAVCIPCSLCFVVARRQSRRQRETRPDQTRPDQTTCAARAFVRAVCSCARVRLGWEWFSRGEAKKGVPALMRRWHPGQAREDLGCSWWWVGLGSLAG